MTSDIVFGEVILPGILAVVVYLVALVALVLGRRWAAGPATPRQASKEPRPSTREPRLRVIAGGVKHAANRA